ncbi:MAG: hypothetical protein ABR608_05220 [Pseudonocardiaceae bacterium]
MSAEVDGMSAEVDLDPDRLRGVANELADLQVAVVALTRHLQQCTATAAHFGAPDAAGQLGTAFAASREDVRAALARVGQLVSTLADELRASADVAVAADQCSAQQLRAAGEGMA